MKKFEIGQIYTTRSACDHDCIYTMRVISRTAKTIIAEHDICGEHTARLRVYDPFGEGVEYVRVGRYSMAPTFRAK